MSTTTISVTGAAPYDITIGRGILDRVSAALAPSVRKVLVVHPPTLALRAAELRERLLADSGNGPHEVLLAEVPDAEQGKRIEVAAFCWQVMGQADFTRTDAVVGYGGGAVTDLAGFVAATWLRGVQVVQVPTTVLGLVDASVGGKTGVNTAEGKNLVGAFWQPAAVVCDLDVLATLPERELRSGRGELAKYHFLTGLDLLDMDLAERVAAAVRIKAEVVAADEHEDPANLRGRATLNYGHTLAHALETAGRYDLRHGEAVAIGLVYAAELASRLGRIDTARVAEHRAVIGAYDLSADLPSGSDPDQLVALMGRDKKALDGLTFVLDGPDGVEVVAGVDPAVARAALEALR